MNALRMIGDCMRLQNPGIPLGISSDNVVGRANEANDSPVVLPVEPEIREFDPLPWPGVD